MVDVRTISLRPPAAVFLALTLVFMALRAVVGDTADSRRVAPRAGFLSVAPRATSATGDFVTLSGELLLVVSSAAGFMSAYNGDSNVGTALATGLTNSLPGLSADELAEVNTTILGLELQSGGTWYAHSREMTIQKDISTEEAQASLSANVESYFASLVVGQGIYDFKSVAWMLDSKTLVVLVSSPTRSFTSLDEDLKLQTLTSTVAGAGGGGIKNAVSFYGSWGDLVSMSYIIEIPTALAEQAGVSAGSLTVTDDTWKELVHATQMLVDEYIYTLSEDIPFVAQTSSTTTSSTTSPMPTTTTTTTTTSSATTTATTTTTTTTTTSTTSTSSTSSLTTTATTTATVTMEVTTMATTITASPTVVETTTPATTRRATTTAASEAAATTHSIAETSLWASSTTIASEETSLASSSSSPSPLSTLLSTTTLATVTASMQATTSSEAYMFQTSTRMLRTSLALDTTLTTMSNLGLATTAPTAATTVAATTPPPSTASTVAATTVLTTPALRGSTTSTYSSSPNSHTRTTTSTTSETRIYDSYLWMAVEDGDGFESSVGTLSETWSGLEISIAKVLDVPLHSVLLSSVERISGLAPYWWRGTRRLDIVQGTFWLNFTIEVSADTQIAESVVTSELLAKYAAEVNSMSLVDTTVIIVSKVRSNNYEESASEYTTTVESTKTPTDSPLPAGSRTEDDSSELLPMSANVAILGAVICCCSVFISRCCWVYCRKPTDGAASVRLHDDTVSRVSYSLSSPKEKGKICVQWKLDASNMVFMDTACSENSREAQANLQMLEHKVPRHQFSGISTNPSTEEDNAQGTSPTLPSEDMLKEPGCPSIAVPTALLDTLQKDHGVEVLDRQRDLCVDIDNEVAALDVNISTGIGWEETWTMESSSRSREASKSARSCPTASSTPRRSLPVWKEGRENAISELQEENGYPLYKHNEVVEYWSHSNSVWVRGRCEWASREGPDGEISFIYNVVAGTGSRVQRRNDIPPDRLRPPMGPGEEVEVYSTSQSSWLPGVMEEQQSALATSTGYLVATYGAVGCPAKAGYVSANRLRRCYSVGEYVEVYRGPKIGWSKARLCRGDNPVPPTPAPLTPYSPGGEGFEESPRTEISPELWGGYGYSPRTPRTSLGFADDPSEMTERTVYSQAPPMTPTRTVDLEAHFRAGDRPRASIVQLEREMLGERSMAEPEMSIQESTAAHLERLRPCLSRGGRKSTAASISARGPISRTSMVATPTVASTLPPCAPHDSARSSELARNSHNNNTSMGPTSSAMTMHFTSPGASAPSPWQMLNVELLPDAQQHEGEREKDDEEEILIGSSLWVPSYHIRRPMNQEVFFI